MSAEADPDELEMLDIEDDPPEEANEIQDDQPASFEGPRAWEEVEENESQRVSLNISTHAVPSNDSGEAAARLAWQAAALEADSQDPLGMGRIDAHGLRLVRQERAAARFGIPKRNDALLVRKGNINRRNTKEAANDAVKAAATKPFLDLSGNIEEYRQQVMPTQDSFEAAIYLAILHGDTTLSDLKTGQANLKFEVSERTGQLKDLVKDNFERFISCKSTIDDIHMRLRKAEGDYGDSADGASTADMVAAVTDVQQEAKRAVASMLERASMSDRIKSVMGLLRRYEALFSLPTRIMQETERGDFDTVVSEYRKAKGIMADVAAEGPTEGVWHNLFLEVDKGVDMMTAKLTNLLRSPYVTVRQAADAMKHLLHLHAEGARSTHHLDPIKLFLEAQTAHVKQTFAAAEVKHKASLKQLMQAQAQQEASDVQWQHLQGGHEDALGLSNTQSNQSAEARMQPASTSTSLMPDATTSAAEAGLWLQFLAKLTGQAVDRLPQVWQLVQEHLGPMSGISTAAQTMVSNAQPLAVSLLQDALSDFRARAAGVLGRLSQAETQGDTFLGAVQLIAQGCKSMFEVSELPGLLLTLTQVLQEAGKLCFQSMRASCSNRITRQLLQQEAQGYLPHQNASGGAASIPRVLAALLQKHLALLRAIFTEAEQAGITGLESLSAELRLVLHDCFQAFTRSAKSAARLLPQPAEAATEPDEDQIESLAEPQAQPQAPAVTDAQLLLHHSNCAYVRTKVLSHVLSRYEYWLAADGQQEQLQELSEQCETELQEVEEQIMTAYISSKSKRLDEVLQSFLQEDMDVWPYAQPPTQLRDSCLQLVFSLIGVRAEMHTLPSEQRQEVIQSLLQHILQSFKSAVEMQLSDISVGGLLQLLLELQYMHAALAAYVSSRLEQKFVELGALLTERIQDAQQQEQQAQAEQLDAWLSQAQGQELLECMQARLAQVLTMSSAGQQHNLRALRT